MRYTHLLFDLDGTLTDPKVGITTCVRHALAQCGIPVDDPDSLLPYIGPPLRHSFQTLHGLSPEAAERAVILYRERFSTIGMYENEVYPGIPDMLAALRQKGYVLGVATSKMERYAREILAHFHLAEPFHHIFGSTPDGSLSEKGDIIRKAMTDCGYPADRTLMVGDTKYDIEGARENGLDAVAVSYGYGMWSETLAARPTFTCDSVQALHRLLDRLANEPDSLRVP